MFNFTKQERLVLAVIACVFLVGTTFRYADRHVFLFKHFMSFMNQPERWQRVNLNKASEEQLIDLPYIGPATARRIIEYRQKNGSFERVEDLLNIQGIYPQNYKKFYRYLTIPGASYDKAKSKAVD